MINITEWLKIFNERLNQDFPDNIYFIGLQGSYARGEAKESSDIDIVVIFDRLTADDLQKYKLFLDTMPEREKICGFVSGFNELKNWDTSDLFQFCYDTLPVKGSLEDLFILVDPDSIKRAVKIGACNIYHACVHNFLHERDSAILKGLYKSAAFVIQAVYFLRTGHYIKTHSELSHVVNQNEKSILIPETSDFDDLSRRLFMWAGQQITYKWIKE